LRFDRLPRDRTKADDNDDVDTASSSSTVIMAPPRRESNIVRGTLAAARLAVVLEQARKLLALMPARRSEQLINRLCQFENLDVAGTSRVQLDDLLRRTRGKVLLKVFFDVLAPGAPYITLGVGKSATAREVCQLVCAKRLCPALHRACQLVVVNGSGAVSPMADHDRPAPLSLVWAAKQLPPSERSFVLRLKPEFDIPSRGSATPSPVVAPTPPQTAADAAAPPLPPKSPTLAQPPLPWRAAPRLDAEIRRSRMVTPPNSSPSLDRRTPPTPVVAPTPVTTAAAPAVEESGDKVYGFIPRTLPPLAGTDESDLSAIEAAFGGVAAELALGNALDSHDAAVDDGEVMTEENAQYFFDFSTTESTTPPADAFGIELDSLLELDDLDTSATTESAVGIDEFQRLLNDVESVQQDLEDQLARTSARR
jgi:nitrate reductase NapAB chaperone NapD